jgi:hypothetical protein
MRRMAVHETCHGDGCIHPSHQLEGRHPRLAGADEPLQILPGLVIEPTARGLIAGQLEEAAGQPPLGLRCGLTPGGAQARSPPVPGIDRPSQRLDVLPARR